MANTIDPDWKYSVEQALIRSTRELLGDCDVGCGRCGARYPNSAMHYCPDTVVRQHITDKPAVDLRDWPSEPARGRRAEELQLNREATQTGRIRADSENLSAKPKSRERQPIGLAGKCLNCSKAWNISGLDVMQPVRCPDCEGFVVTPSGKADARVFWAGEEEALVKIPKLP